MRRSIWSMIVTAACLWLLALATAAMSPVFEDDKPAIAPDDHILANSRQMLREGRRTFRFDTLATKRSGATR
jgi:hypothetical protein